MREPSPYDSYCPPIPERSQLRSQSYKGSRTSTFSVDLADLQGAVVAGAIIRRSGSMQSMTLYTERRSPGT
jgi:hypothetical protein